MGEPHACGCGALVVWSTTTIGLAARRWSPVALLLVLVDARACKKIQHNQSEYPTHRTY